MDQAETLGARSLRCPRCNSEAVVQPESDRCECICGFSWPVTSEQLCSECAESWDEEDGYADNDWLFCRSCIEQASYELGYSWWITVGVL